MYYNTFGDVMKKLIPFLLLYILSAFFIISCDETKPKIDKIALMKEANTVFEQLPDEMPGSENDTPEIIALGGTLYFDVRLSKENNQSCNTCHIIDNNGAGDDNLPVSPGSITNAIGFRNSTTVLNAGFHFAQFWDGRAPDLKEQAKGPILNPIEMGMPSEKAVVKKIGAISEYKAMFKNAGMKLTFDNIAEALAAFERTLITKDRFDLFLNGNPQALTDEEAEGLKIFIDKDCIMCHTGPLLGGNMFQQMGFMKAYSDTTDKGRFDLTGDEEDLYMFKVPSLRNIALTYPYFHDGQAADLKTASIIMVDIQLEDSLSVDETIKIVKFMESLSDIKIAKAQKKMK
jgi:cytochrome c peroxidase